MLTHVLARFRERKRLLGLGSALAWAPEEALRRSLRVLTVPLWRFAQSRSSQVLEHLPGRDPARLRSLLEQETGQEAVPYRIDPKAYAEYLKEADYPALMYGDPNNPRAPFHEKTLEHFVAFDLLQLKRGQVFMDIASNLSRVPDIATRLFGCQSYRQDLIYPKGVHGDLVGSSASEIPLNDGSLDALTLHCSFEHFRGDEDRLFIQEAARLLKPGGRVVILPLYIAEQHTLVTHHLFGGPSLQEEGVEFSARVRLREGDFSRLYHPRLLKSRVLDADPRLSPTFFFVENHDATNPHCYLKFILVLTRKS